MYLKTILSNSLISLLILSNISFAQETNVQYLEKNQPAPYTGYLFTPQKTNELRLTTIERDNYKLLNDSLQKSLDLEKNVSDLNSQKVNILLQQNDKLAVDLQSARSTSDWTKALWFILGVAATGAAIYGGSKITK